jgi:hypothetical protein
LIEVAPIPANPSKIFVHFALIAIYSATAYGRVFDQEVFYILTPLSKL